MRKGNSIAWLVVFAGILLILGAGCVQKGSLASRYNQAQADETSGNTGSSNSAAAPQTPDLSAEIAECGKEGNSAKRDLCLMELAQSKKSDDPCPLLETLSSDRCYYKVAIAAEEDVYCGKIRDSLTNAECLKETGLLNGNPATCAKIVSDTDYRDECYYNSAEKNRNAELCGKIFGPATRDECYINYSGFAKDHSPCENVSRRKTGDGYLRDQCYEASGKGFLGEECANFIDEELRADCFLEADNAPSIEVDCTQFSDTNSMRACSDWYGRKAGDIGSCYNLGDDNSILGCLGEAILNGTEADSCEKISPKHSAMRNECYRKTAENNNDEGLCEKIVSNARVKAECYASIAITKKDPGICAKISAGNISEKDACYSRIALETLEYSECENISSPRAYISCYSGIALALEAPEMCALAERESLPNVAYSAEDNCYKEYAVAIENDDTCARISVAALKEDCEEEVGLALICEDDDGECDEDYCTWQTDSDCDSPYDCKVDANCSDGIAATLDECVKGKCIFTYISGCNDNDGYCPRQCTYPGDPNAVFDSDTNSLNEDSDCEYPACSALGGVVCDDDINEVCEDGHEIDAFESGCCEPGYCFAQ